MCGELVVHAADDLRLNVGDFGDRDRAAGNVKKAEVLVLGRPASDLDHLIASLLLAAPTSSQKSGRRVSQTGNNYNNGKLHFEMALKRFVFFLTC